ncbi:A/G-specific DNA-adenine glycosylase [Natranaerovirga hydrolytica]|uniref:Adenine DNA glycosylase n=1 Tax=Natranaerovirga hydrolytica TaxID=680378 RepID=A0A4R1N652_9FIRM|nr:A/G-specific adenine glycosylase [Natranaerovirga hydrolytica]TCK98499.1 A/G-specific DNA-adenine glycosylase [Natranaerovirga hydrolytica]
MQTEYFYTNLIQWYKKVQRQLPWRESYQPYTVWLSEIMLQQTQVITVVDYYKRFLKAYPTIFDLSSADEDDIFKLWEGLGYYSRARNLIRCAKLIVEDYNGDFPKNKKELMKLPGIGPYTAGAILSIAYNQKEPAVDGNVMRVISRYRALNVNISEVKNKKIFEEEVQGLMGGEPRDFNQGLMELGATVCTPKNAKCTQCPVQEGCHAFANQTVYQYPVKLKKIKKQTKEMAVIILEVDQTLFITKRPNTGLMSNLWGFPVTERINLHSYVDIEAYMEEAFGLKVNVNQVEEGAKHIFTHLIWHMKLYKCTLKESSQAFKKIDYPEILWVNRSELENYAFPTAFKKVFKLI